MITFIIGKRNAEFEKTLNKALGGVQDVERVRTSAEMVTRVLEDVQTGSLFGEKKTFVISGIFEDADAKEKFWEGGAALRAAPHDVVILSEILLAADLKKAESIGTVHKILEKEKKSSPFNPFGLGNAFASADKKNAWIMLQQARAAGDEAEKTHGLVWWKLKDMMQKNSAYSKAQTIAMARDLVAAYHESRLGGLGLDERLELFFLNLPSGK